MIIIKYLGEDGCGVVRKDFRALKGHDIFI
jgi:hypothetical protein